MMFRMLFLLNSLVEEGKEVAHHNEDRSGNGQEDLTDVQRSLIQVFYSFLKKKKNRGGGQKEYVVSNKKFINQKNKSIYNKFFSGSVHGVDVWGLHLCNLSTLSTYSQV